VGILQADYAVSIEPLHPSPHRRPADADLRRDHRDLFPLVSEPDDPGMLPFPLGYCTRMSQSPEANLLVVGQCTHARTIASA